MKKISALMIAFVMMLSLVACNSSNSPNSNSDTPSQSNTPNSETSTPETNNPEGDSSEISGSTDGNALIVYFTRANNVDQEPGVDAVSRATFNVQGDGIYGNTELIARYINESIGGDLLPLEVSSPYPYDVDSTIQEIDDNGDPRTITTKIENLDQYDVVFVGFPIWYATMPEPVSKFLAEYDFSDKTIVPFSTHRGSRFGSSVNDLKELMPDATFLEGYTVAGDDAHDAQEEVIQWLKDIGMEKK